MAFLLFINYMIGGKIKIAYILMLINTQEIATIKMGIAKCIIVGQVFIN